MVVLDIVLKTCIELIQYVESAVNRQPGLRRTLVEQITRLVILLEFPLMGNVSSFISSFRIFSRRFS